MAQREYVAGLMFSIDEDSVLLIRKNRPEWQVGKLNGIGGKIEEKESNTVAMCREFEEETGIRTEQREWHRFLLLTNGYGRDCYNVNFYMTHGDIAKAKQMTDEELVIVSVKPESYGDLVIPNLKWIIPMALDMEVHDSIVYTK